MRILDRGAIVAAIEIRMDHFADNRPGPDYRDFHHQIVKALRTIGAEIVDVVIVFEKTREKARFEKELGLRIKTLLKVDVVQGKLVERA